MNDVIQSLWIGDSLSKLEQLSIESFLQNGHPYDLYTYSPVENVPLGVAIKDANKIIPYRDLFEVRGGFSSFSDFFRWKLILDKGGWWCDTDTICLKPFDFADDYVFVGGTGPVGSDDCISSGMFKAPAGAEILRWGWQKCVRMSPETMTWGQAGPPLFTQAVHEFKMFDKVVPARLFFPVFYTKAPEIFVSLAPPEIPEECYSLHFFNEVWRLAETDKNGDYPQSSLYERLKKRFL